LPPKNPRPTEPSPTNPGASRRHALLALLVVCASLAFTLPTNAYGSPRPAQEQKQPQPTPTPYVRPRRTVAPKETSEPQPTAQPAPTPPAATPQPQAARPENAEPGQPQSTSSQAPEEVDEDEVVRVDSNLVIIPASVVDGFGRAITDLKVNDFELKIDGEVKTIGELTRSETPVNVALLFDNSYSLSAAREFEKQAAVRFFRSVVRPIDRAAVYSISNTPRLAQGLTNDVPRLVRTVEGFGAPDGATALFEAVAQAADYMRPLPGRKVLVIVSDGADTVSEVSFDDAVNKALRAECQVYVVQTRQVEDPNLHDPVSEQRMYRLTEQTGGAVYVPRAVEELDAVFTQISLDLSQQYLLSYYPQDERKDKYFRFISLRVKSRPTLRVRARKGFFPDASQALTPDGRAQSASSRTNTSTPNLTATPARAADASYKRAAAETAAQPAPARNKLGPDGPDTEEAARQKAVVIESVPTFTVTVSAPSVKTPAVASPAAEPPAPAAPGQRVAGNSLFGAAANNPVEAASTPTAQPKPAADPAPRTPAPAAVETRDEKASANRQAVSEARPAEASKPAGDEAPKAPLSAGVLNGKAIRLPVPAYPSAARNSGAQGRVVVEVTIDEQGKVIEARAVSGHTFLQQAAVQAARQARFTPALLSGQPVKVKGTINYVFTLP
jgi:Ca-activated chloride channel family protein